MFSFNLPSVLVPNGKQIHFTPKRDLKSNETLCKQNQQWVTVFQQETSFFNYGPQAFKTKILLSPSPRCNPCLMSCSNKSLRWVFSDGL